MNQVNAITAFLAGMISFLSPCVLPLIPGYLSLMSGLSLKEMTEGGSEASTRRVVFLAVLFVAGFSVVFTLLGAFASGLGSPLSAHMPLLRKLAGTLIVLFGLHTMGLLPIKWLYYQKSVSLSRFKPGPLGAFFMGMAFSFGWTPCVGPILASVLALAATEGSAFRGMGLLLVFSLGLGIPFILTACGVGAFMRFLNRYRRYVRWGEWAAGALLVAVGALVFTNHMSDLARAFSFLGRFSL